MRESSVVCQFVLVYFCTSLKRVSCLCLPLCIPSVKTHTTTHTHNTRVNTDSMLKLYLTVLFNWIDQACDRDCVFWKNELCIKSVEQITVHSCDKHRHSAILTCDWLNREASCVWWRVIGGVRSTIRSCMEKQPEQFNWADQEHTTDMKVVTHGYTNTHNVEQVGTFFFKFKTDW